ncbi:MAG: DUF1802 family protein [Verrucomicrobiota bacterium]|nr:DUF1802 family protein [Verrucomicrobiota bacterium]
MQTINLEAGIKEWVAIIDALVTGNQILIFRKGGLADVRPGFKIEAKSFWLFPTRFHEKADLIKHPTGGTGPKTGSISVSGYAEIAMEPQYISQWETIKQLDEYHVWNHQALRTRFEFTKNKGLWVLILRVYEIPEPHIIEDKPEYAGCQSWVKLPKLSTLGAKPVLEDTEFSRISRTIRGIIS